MIRHSLIRQAVVMCVVILLCVPLIGNSQRVPGFMQQKTAALIGKYLVSFRSDAGILRYVLYIDSVQGVFFFGRMENDLRYHPARRDFCRIKGILAERNGYEFVMKPVLTPNSGYTISCAPYEWVLNNKTYFRLEEDVIKGYMLVSNGNEMPTFAFSGMRQH